MRKYEFKTNINCQNCVNTVKPALDNLQLEDWSVDTTNKDKTLTVVSKASSADEVIAAVQNAGFTISKKANFIKNLFS
jgi:copper chaperone CopZ